MIPFSQVNGVIGSNFNDTLSGTDSAIHGDLFFGGVAERLHRWA